ncbi:hypothetical protein [Sphingobacterium lumbrici]|uniref:hypothetical protein n=1 Tax=Sphingobacterium lumbrici TaxID=2559600 RepID=UPI00112A4BA1|nr:hypothetical protein [Sphingobacterium lumbrici]
MSVNLSQVQSLIYEIEFVSHKKFSTPSDFQDLSVGIFKETKDSISVSTLKRLWGYIPRREKVRKSTLDILSRYLGYENFEAFCQVRSSDIESAFLSNSVISASDLTVGIELEIGWLPNRLCRIKYQGDNKFLILKAEYTRLISGTVFESPIIALNQPLLMNILTGTFTEEKPYVIGKKTGLTILRVFDNAPSRR